MRIMIDIEHPENSGSRIDGTSEKKHLYLSDDDVVVSHDDLCNALHCIRMLCNLDLSKDRDRGYYFSGSQEWVQMWDDPDKGRVKITETDWFGRLAKVTENHE